jgi:hypothetical protein
MNPPHHSDEPPTYRYDPELPFLYELEREVRRRAIEAAHSHGRQRSPASSANADLTSDPAHRRSGPTPTMTRRTGMGERHQARSRLLRRSLTLVALLCLIGASAFGAGDVLSNRAPNPAAVNQSAFIRVAGGRAGPDTWSLRLYVRNGEICRVLLVAEAASSRCSSVPSARTLGVTSVVSPTRRYLYGVSGAAVTRVAIHAGQATVSVPTHALPVATTRAARLPAGVHWFVAVLHRPVGEPDPQALVRGSSSTGSFTTKALSDCSEAPEAQPCQ